MSSNWDGEGNLGQYQGAALNAQAAQQSVGQQQSGDHLYARGELQAQSSWIASSPSSASCWRTPEASVVRVSLRVEWTVELGVC